MKEHIYSVKALLHDVLSESDYLTVYAGFQSQIAFCSKNRLKKQAAATLKNSKHKQARWVTQILWVPHTQRSSPLYAITEVTPFSGVAFQQYDSNGGQINLKYNPKNVINKHD